MDERTAPKKMARRIARMLRKERPDHNYLRKVFSYVRDELELAGGKAQKKLPELLTDKEIARFYEAVLSAADRTHMVMIKLLLFTGVRNAELGGIRPGDIDLDACTIRINQGKGDKERCVPFPRAFRDELAQFLEAQKSHGCAYLFETNRLDKFSPRWICGILKRYAEQAGIEKRIYPHLFRHQLLAYLAKKGVVDAELQLISGHGDRRGLEVYQELSLAGVVEEYQKAMRSFPVAR